MQREPTELDIFLAKFVPLIAIVLGAVIKLGDDLLSKRQLTFRQKIGLYLITIGFGFVGWWFCVWLKYEDFRVPIIITSMSYMGEHILQWFVKNRVKIFNYFTFKHWNKSK